MISFSELQPNENQQEPTKDKSSPHSEQMEINLDDTADDDALIDMDLEIVSETKQQSKSTSVCSSIPFCNSLI